MEASSLRCASLHSEGTASAKNRSTLVASGLSKSIGRLSRMKAPATLDCGTRQCGIATPWPRPVEPSRSRWHSASKMSRLLAAWSPWASNWAALSSTDFLLARFWSSTTRSALSKSASGMEEAIWGLRLGDAGSASASFSRPIVLVMVGDLALVPANLAVQPVGKLVYGRVHVLGHPFGVDGIGPAAYTDRRLCGVLDLLEAQDHVNTGQVVEVPLEPLELLGDICPQRLGDFYILSADVHLHHCSPFPGLCRPAYGRHESVTTRRARATIQLQWYTTTPNDSAWRSSRGRPSAL